MSTRHLASFPASAVSRDELGRIMGDYLAWQRVRAFRRGLLTRCGVLAFAAAVGGLLHWLLPFAAWCIVGVFLVPLLWAWVVELRREARLASRLEQVPEGVTHEVPPIRDIRKS